MKKAPFLLALSLGILSLTQSCIKCDNLDAPPAPTALTVNATVNENGTYSYTLSAAGKNSVPMINVPATHSSASTITANANGSYTYEYVPASNYTGTDVVVISTQQPNANGGGGCFGSNPGNCGQGKHGCNHNGAPAITTTFNITVTPANASASKITVNSKNAHY